MTINNKKPNPMKLKFNQCARFQFNNLMVISTIFMVLLGVSCKEETNSAKTTESELILKINAVKEQVMAQGTMTEKEEQALLSLCSIVSQEDGMAIYTSDDSIILKDVDIAPVYNGCEELSIEDTRDCFNTKISTFIKREFNLSVSKDLNLSEKMNEIRVVCDQVGSPTNASDLAKTIMEILPKIENTSVEIYHYSNEGVCSWYDFAFEIFKIKGIKSRLIPVSSSEYKVEAVRPNYSLLSKTKIKQNFNINIPHWKTSLIQTLLNSKI